MLNKFITCLVYLYYLLLVKTVRSTLIGYDLLQHAIQAGRNPVFCCAHNALLALLVAVDSRQDRPDVAVLVSLSQDGELISNILEKRHYTVIRGSSSRGAKAALLNLQRKGKVGQCLGLAFDGPRGPALVPKKGLIACARVASGPLFLIHAHAQKSWPKAFRVASWDRFLVLLPFCKVKVVIEKIPEQYEVNMHTDTEYEAFLLKYIEQRSKEIYGYLV